MKKLFIHYPVISRFVLAIILGILTLLLSGLIQNDQMKTYFPFTGVILLTAATWILYRTDNKSLKAIGLTITVKHMALLATGLFTGLLCAGSASYLRTVYTGERWHLSSFIDQAKLWKGLYFILPSVVIQELLFRGYLFTKTIEVSNAVKANIIFAILFMLVHVIDRDILKSPVQVIFLFISIPVGHLLFATALLRSKTLFLPIGLHWGNNWAVNHFLGYTNNDHTLFYTSNHRMLNDWPSFIAILSLYNLVFITASLVIWKWPKRLSSREYSKPVKQ